MIVYSQIVTEMYTSGQFEAPRASMTLLHSPESFATSAQKACNSRYSRLGRGYSFGGIPSGIVNATCPGKPAKFTAAGPVLIWYTLATP